MNFSDLNFAQLNLAELNFAQLNRTDLAMPTSESPTDELFLKLNQYDVPAMPTQDSVRRWYDSLVRFFKSDVQVEAEHKSSLEKASRPLLNQAVRRPAYAHAIEDLNDGQLPWMKEFIDQKGTDDLRSADDETIRLLIMPPCETSNVVKVWAEKNDLEVLPVPTREEIIGHAEGSTDAVGRLLSKDGPLVIARLEDFMLRHHKGLSLVREILKAANQSGRRILIGCNAWAWEYLIATVSADKLLPVPITFAPYHADRLEQWLYTMIEGEGGPELKLKFYGAYNKDRDSDSPSQLFYQLAALSRGTPWVAWAMIRARLELVPDDADKAKTVGSDTASNSAANDPTEATELWVAPAVERTISPKLRSDGLLILHSLLIHGELTMEQLQQTVPVVSDFNVVYGLLRSGFMERQQDRLRCAACHYPTVRKELNKSGFPIAEL